MNVVLVSRSGVQYVDGSRGAIEALFVPSKEKTQRFNDLTTINNSTVKNRYGDQTATPLWRQLGNAVYVYGVMPHDLVEKREAVSVFLPEDYIPLGSNTYYFVFGEKWVVHGTREIAEDGTAYWVHSRVDVEETGAANMVIESVSERLLQHTENITVAVQGNADALSQLQQSLKTFNIEPVRFDSLPKHKEAKPLYEHRDHSLMMMILVMLSGIAFSVFAFQTFLSYMDLQSARNDMRALEERIAAQQQKVLGGIRKPKTIMKYLRTSMDIQPSALLHTASDAASAFGRLESIELSNEVEDTKKKRRTRKSKEVTKKITAFVSVVNNALLIDQERLAQSVLETRPAVRSIERVDSGGERMQLSIEVQVK